MLLLCLLSALVSLCPPRVPVYAHKRSSHHWLAGTTGLALAQGLRKAGIKCTVFEKNATQHRDRDWNMGLHWAAPSLKSLMPDGWWARIQSVQVDPHVPTKDQDTLNWIQCDTGESMAAFTFGPFYRLRRAKILELLLDGLDVQYGKYLDKITYSDDRQSVTAHFTDGTSSTGSFLVGADGARSSARQLLLGPQLGAINRIPFAATWIQQRYTRDQAIYLRKFHPLFLAGAHPAGNFAFFGMHDAADPDDPSSWTFFFYISWKSSLEEQEADSKLTNAQHLANAKELAKGFCDPWKSAYEWATKDARIDYFGMTDWDPGLEGHRWDNHDGLVTLVGDSVHPMTFQRGQGLNHSVTDAAKLRDVLVQVQNGGDRKALVTQFEDEVIARGGKEVRDGTANTTLLHDWEKVKQSPFFTRGVST